MNIQSLSVTGLAGNATKLWTADSQNALVVLFGHAILINDATVANRFLRLGLIDPDGNIVSETHAGAAATASQTVHYTLKPGIFREAAFINGELEFPFAAGLLVPPGWSLELYIDGGVAGDTLECHIAVNKKSLSSIQ